MAAANRRRWRNKEASGPVGCAEVKAEAGADWGRNPVMRFKGPHLFLSNFFWSPLTYEGVEYPSVEHAFQAAKLRDSGERVRWGFADSSITFGQAKRLGRQVQLREDWHQIREGVMAACLAAKFVEPGLRRQLLATGDRYLVDGHSGSPDLIWGYHEPSQAGENRLGLLLMELRAQLRQSEPRRQAAEPVVQPEAGHSATGQRGEKRGPATSAQGAAAAGGVAVYHLDWPMKCLHDGLPAAYAARIESFARHAGLSGGIVILPRRKICIALRGPEPAIDAWEHRMCSELVDTNSNGRPCRERMLANALRRRCGDAAVAPPAGDAFASTTAESWQELCGTLAASLDLSRELIGEALGPEPPELPRTVSYAKGRTAVFLDGVRYPLCLNESEAGWTDGELLGDPRKQQPRGAGEAVELVYPTGGKPSIFGGRFARTVEGLLSAQECATLIKLAEDQGFGLAGSRGFNPFARFAMRSLCDAPQIAAVLTARLAQALPAEYPPRSGRRLIGVNDRCRFLKYLPGMHHSGDHTDCAFEDPERGKSHLTIQIYLNDAFQGGRTTFISERLVPVDPKPGLAMIFDHELYHRGGQVVAGTKYAVRLDVMYSHPPRGGSRTPPSPGRRGGNFQRRPGKGADGADEPGAKRFSGKGSGRWRSRVSTPAWGA